jgi:prepilin-type processing-associated H-X9-DG protein
MSVGIGGALPALPSQQGVNDMDAERLVAEVFNVPEDVAASDRHLVTMANVLMADGHDPSEVHEFVVKAALAYDELIRTLRTGKADPLFRGDVNVTISDLVQSCFSAPARSLGVESLEKAIQAVVDRVRLDGFEDTDER